ncbi:MAG: acyltransferase family protein [Sphingomicrobium sp.]
MFAYRQISADKSHESFPLFDWLRFVLASVVALYHEGTIPWEHAGNFAVQIFFALSGWLIGGILLKSDRKDLPRFYFNRATRIWIPYFIAVAVLYALAAYGEGIDQTWWRCLIFDGTFTHNWFIDPAHMPLHGTGNHFWSISVEEQFYLAAPLLIVLLPFGRSKWLWGALSIVAVASHFWYGSICLGVLAAIIRPKAWVAPVTAGLALLLLLVNPSLYDWLCSPTAAGIVVLLSRSGPRSRTGEFLGGVSYPLYLYHWTGAFVAHAVHLPIAYPVAVGSGALAYLAVDRNVMRLRARFYRPAIGQALMLTAYGLIVCGCSAAI